MLYNFRAPVLAGSIWCLILLLSFSSANADKGSKTVLAKGVAAIAGENIQGARVTAVENALRNAIEQGVGTMMDAKSIVKNDQLLEQIYTHTQGYIAEYEIVREKEAPGGLYRVTVAAVIKTTALKNRLAQLGIIKQMMGHPRLVIVTGNDSSGRSEAVQTAGRTLAGSFTDQRFDVVAGGPVKAAGASGPQGGAPADLGRDRHAEIVVVYTLAAESSRFDGVMETVPVTVAGRAVVTATGQVLSSEQARVSGLGNSSRAALMDGTRKAAKQLGTALSEDIVGWWAEYTANGLPYQIVLHTPPPAAARQVVTIQQHLQAIPGVSTVTERSTEQGITRLRLTYKGRTVELKQQILAAIPRVEVVASQGRYLELSIK